MMGQSDILVGVEVGTSKICVVVGESGRGGEIRILGVGCVPSRGVRKGEIVDMAIAVECTLDALTEAEENSETEFDEVAIAVTGSHIRSFNSRGAIQIPEDRDEISEEDLEEVAVKAREVNIPPENSFLHSIIQHYYLDGQEGVVNPLGCFGRRLEADFHIIHGVKTRVQNTLRCIEEAGKTVELAVVNSLASAHAVLNEHQRQMGAVVLDIGGGVTDFIVFSDGVVCNSGVLAVGGDHITNDICLGLRLPLTRAEKLKVEEASALLGTSRPGEMITLKNDAGFSGKEIEREMLNRIVNMRLEEMFELVRKQVFAELSPHKIGAGIFLTGGCSRLRGIRELAEKIFDLPVVLARDAGVAGPTSVLSNPDYSTAIGVVKFLQARREEERARNPGLLKSLLHPLKLIFGR